MTPGVTLKGHADTLQSLVTAGVETLCHPLLAAGVNPLDMQITYVDNDTVQVLHKNAIVGTVSVSWVGLIATVRVQRALDAIRILYRAPDTLALYGIPYGMRPGQEPHHLRRAGNTAGWIWLGQPGWYGSMSRDEQARVKEYLASADVPQTPDEWVRVNDEPDCTACQKNGHVARFCLGTDENRT